MICEIIYHLINVIMREYEEMTKTETINIQI